MKITLNIIEREGLTAVIPSEAEIATTARRLRLRAANAPTPEEKADIERCAAEVEAEGAACRERWLTKAKAEDFMFTPLTQGDLFDLQDQKKDDNAYRMQLVVKATGKSEEEVRAMAPAVFRALANAIAMASDPDMESLDFFGL